MALYRLSRPKSQSWATVHTRRAPAIGSRLPIPCRLGMLSWMGGASLELSAHDPVNRGLRLTFLLDLIAIEYLCHPDSLLSLETAYELLHPRNRRQFLQGYRLAVATPLTNLLKFAVGKALSLGLEYDDRLNHWLIYGSHERGGSILSAISDPQSDLARLCAEFDSLFVSLRRSDHELAQTTGAIQRCGTFGSLLRAALGKCEVVSLRDGSQVADGDSLLRVLIAERVMDYVWPRSYLVSAFRLVWGGEEEFRSPSDESTLEAQTHLDDVFSRPFRTHIPHRWLDGLYSGFDSIVRMDGVSLPSHSESNAGPVARSSWFNELQHFVNPMHPEGRWPSLEYGLAEFADFSKDELMAYLPGNKTVNLETISATARLAAILGPDMVRLFTPGSFADFIDLELFVAGAVSIYPDTLVEILLVTHSVESDDRDWVSIAVRCRRESFIANHTRWYLFYKMFHEGYVTDSDVGRAIKEVEGLLTRFKDNLIVERVEGSTDRDLLSYCELPAFRAMRELSQRAVDVNSELRAGLSELLAAHWLQAQGYRNVKVSLKRASLGEYEYDVLGVKDGECLVIEVKGGQVLDKVLREQISRLGHKVENLRGRLPALSQALAYDGSIDRVSGLFISLADLRGLESADDAVTLWDYNGFVRRLKDVGLTSRLVGLLDRSRIIHSISAFDFLKDPPDVGL